MKMKSTGKSLVIILITLAARAAIVFGDVATPSPARPSAIADQTAGYTWGMIVSSSLFVFAAVLTVLWMTRKLLKRNLK